ncbi:MAG TPA: c-type cytochrome [Bryobacteraceae bacterium]|nr:c-type cytochrome [Bryobacteraceae bacterium]
MERRILAAFVAGVAAVTLCGAWGPDDQSPKKAGDIKVVAEQSGCFKCHSVDKKVIGPSFRDIATRYKNAPRAQETLRNKVKNGGKGNWTDVTGGVLMPPHSALLPESLIAQLVDWVLSR